MKMPYRPRPAFARGRTLIELMIAMAIGLAMSALLLGIFLTANQNTRVIDEYAVMQNSARFAQQVVARHLRDAGYAPVIDPTTPPYVTKWADANYGPYIWGCPNTPSATPDAARFSSGMTDVSAACSGGDGDDAIEVRATTVNYNSQTGEGGDCAGQASAGSFVTNRFFVALQSTTGRGALYCQGSGTATAQPIASDVEQMVVWYGVNATDDVWQSADNWQRSTTLTAADWAKVSAVRICMVLSAQQTGTVTNSATYTYRDCTGAQKLGDPIKGTVDGRIRRAYWMTVTLRNSVRGEMS